MTGSCLFTYCNSNVYGGGLFLTIQGLGAIIITGELEFDQCETLYYGGGIHSSLESGGKLTISGSSSFTDCKTLEISSGGGGAIYALIIGENSLLTLEDQIMFLKCLGYQGGGLLLPINNNGSFTMTGNCSFTDCNSTLLGGGCVISASIANYDIQLLGSMRFDGCNSLKSGGGLYIQSKYAGQITINEMSFSNCNSTQYGGGIYSQLYFGVQITIIGKVTFDNCNCLEGYGGGQFVYVYGSDSKINITGEL
ncbi:MAG: hypothetical protein EZS28_053095, partial [Streblomastix strix]